VRLLKLPVEEEYSQPGGQNDASFHFQRDIQPHMTTTKCITTNTLHHYNHEPTVKNQSTGLQVLTTRQ